ncbi:MAG: FtsW/RodA/SpoVE family cell cycle protein, partial [Planctomycetota bacterium]
MRGLPANPIAGLASGWGGTRLPSITMLTFLIALLVIGTIFVHSATAAGEEPFPGSMARLHIFRIAFGFGFLLFFLVVHYRVLEDLSIPLYLLGLGLLGYVLFKGFVTGEVERWIHLKIINVQPGEVIKLFTVLLLAKLLKPAGRHLGSFDHLLPLVVVGIP